MQRACKLHDTHKVLRAQKCSRLPWMSWGAKIPLSNCQNNYPQRDLGWYNTWSHPWDRGLEAKCHRVEKYYSLYSVFCRGLFQNYDKLCSCSKQVYSLIEGTFGFNPYAAGGQFGQYKMIQNTLQMTETLAHGYSSKSTQRELSNETCRQQLPYC